MTTPQPGRGHESLGLCPVCEEPIKTTQRTTWRSLNGASVRIHLYHLEQG